MHLWILAGLAAAAAAHGTSPGGPRIMAGRAAGRRHAPDAAPAPPAALAPRQASDGRCGAEFGTRCQPGLCCSKQGWCGTGYAYCSSPACQIDYSDSCDGNVRPAGPDTEAVPRPHVGPVPYGEAVYHCEVPGGIAVTFDDGPFIYTEFLLDLLASYKAKATFFVTGRNLGKGAINDPQKPWRQLIKRMVADGHQVASHTWSHQRLPLFGDAMVRRQMLYNEVALADILGFFPTYMRPPYSASNDRVDALLGELGYHITYFNLDTEGYLHDSPDVIQQSKDIWDAAVEGRDPRSTSWLHIEHDTDLQTVHNLTAHVFESLFRNGFRSVTVGECLGDPPGNWYRSVGPGQLPASSTPTSAPTSSPAPSHPPSRDGRCGPAHGGTTCLYLPDDETCCSRAGWCGATADHCGRGCQPEYGSCGSPA